MTRIVTGDVGDFYSLSDRMRAGCRIHLYNETRGQLSNVLHLAKGNSGISDFTLSQGVVILSLGNSFIEI